MKTNPIKTLRELRKKIKELQLKEIKLTNQCIKHIERYGSLKNGLWTAMLDISLTRHPEWKEELIKLVGENKANSILENTLATTHKQIIIMYKGVKVNGK